jgi:hypothetical protein
MHVIPGSGSISRPVRCQPPAGLLTRAAGPPYPEPLCPHAPNPSARRRG